MLTQLPATRLSEVAMVDTATQWIDRVSEKLKTERAHALLRDHIRELLRRGTLPTKAVIDAAREGNAHADFALRKRISEAIDTGEEMSAQLRVYAIDGLWSPPLGHARGEKNIADLYVRDIGIALMVRMAVLYWPPLKPTKNRASKQPSASTIVAKALKRRGFKLSEWQVEKIHGQFETIAARLSATIPVEA